jgi:hypothetical protein
MVAKITSPGSIKRALNYNEQKVQKGTASCLYAGNFLKPAKGLNFYEKLQRFQGLISLNERAKTNTLHISLNFHPSEKLSGKKMIPIAMAYMDKIGFGDQPYLVYEHQDAGHPHIHIVTTTIQPNGKRIDTYNIGKNRSEKARKEIEDSFKLIKASERKGIQQISTVKEKPIYGKSDTKGAITNVLATVLPHYLYTSLAELNAVLKQFNIIADDGREASRVKVNGGLYYKILDEKGKAVGVPIKASAIPLPATLNHLENCFEKNRERRKPFVQKTKTSVEWILRQGPENLLQFIDRLKGENIATVVSQNDKGYIYGISFIDFRTKSVFKGSDLGKGYSAASIQARLCTQQQQENNAFSMPQNDSTVLREHDYKKEGVNKTDRVVNNSDMKLLYELLKPEFSSTGSPPFMKKKKKKRRF